MKEREIKLVERYINAYNDIDTLLRVQLAQKEEKTLEPRKKENGEFKESEPKKPFYNIVDQYFAKGNREDLINELKKYGDLRNSIVHTFGVEKKYIAAPSLETVRRIEAILQELQIPVEPYTSNTLVTFEVTDKLSQILATLNKYNFSQFPILEGTEFKGLLTENGIARGLAKHSNNGQNTVIQFTTITAGDLLIYQEEYKIYDFISRTSYFSKVVELFGEHLELEAILITQTGEPTEPLLGIITRWDILHPQHVMKEKTELSEKKPKTVKRSNK